MIERMVFERKQWEGLNSSCWTVVGKPHRIQTNATFIRSFAHSLSLMYNHPHRNSDSVSRSFTTEQRAKQAWSLGFSLLQQGHALRSLEHFHAALQLDASFARCLVDRAAAYAQLNDLASALRDVDCALACNPTSALALSTRAEVLARMGRFHEALASWNAAIDVDEEDVQYLVSRARTLLALGLVNEAIIDLNDAIEAYPEFVEALMIRGLTLIEMERQEEGERDLASVLELEASKEREIQMTRDRMRVGESFTSTIS